MGFQNFLTPRLQQNRLSMNEKPIIFILWNKKAKHFRYTTALISELKPSIFIHRHSNDFKQPLWQFGLLFQAYSVTQINALHYILEAKKNIKCQQIILEQFTIKKKIYRCKKIQGSLTIFNIKEWLAADQSFKFSCNILLSGWTWAD